MNRPLHLSARELLQALLALLLLAGCGGAKPESPREAYEEFFTLMRVYTQDPQGGLQQAAFDMLSTSSQELLSERAEALNATLPEGTHVRPADLLIGRGTPLGGRIVSVETLDEGEDRATLHVVFETGDTRVTMTREGAHWKVVLPAPPEL